MTLAKIVGKHLMCISVVFELLDKEGNVVQPQQTAAYTCFPMEVQGVILLVTAGHVVRDELEPLIVDKKFAGLNVRVIAVRLCDFFGVEEQIATRMTTPFTDFEGTARFAWDREAKKRDSDGIDIGLFILEVFFWRGFLANGVYPVYQDMWAKPGDVFERHVVGGFPNEPSLRARNEVRTTAYQVTPAVDPDVRVVSGEPVWFVGNLVAGTSIVGVSGGPIFGFRKVPGDLWEHRLVGIQSWQSTSKGLIYGTPISTIGQLLTELVMGLKAAGEAPENSEREQSQVNCRTRRST
jgi:hypothetical protein